MDWKVLDCHERGSKTLPLVTNPDHIQTYENDKWTGVRVVGMKDAEDWNKGGAPIYFCPHKEGHLTVREATECHILNKPKE